MRRGARIVTPWLPWLVPLALGGLHALTKIKPPGPEADTILVGVATTATLGVYLRRGLAELGRQIRLDGRSLMWGLRMARELADEDDPPNPPHGAGEGTTVGILRAIPTGTTYRASGDPTAAPQPLVPRRRSPSPGARRPVHRAR